MYSTVHLKNRNCQLQSLVEFIVVVVVVVDQYFTICEHSFLLAFLVGRYMSIINLFCLLWLVLFHLFMVIYFCCRSEIEP